MADMTTRQIRSSAIIFVVMIGLGIIWGCGDDDTGTGPDGGYPYLAYFCDPGPPAQLFTFNPETGEIDSTEIAYTPQAVSIAPDGKRLYLSLASSVVVLRTSDLGFLAELPYVPNGAVAISPDNSLLAITGEDLTVLRVGSHDVVFHDTDITHEGYFAEDNQTLYCVAGSDPPSNGTAYAVDVFDSTSVIRRSFNGGVTQFIPSPEQTIWYLYYRVTRASIFQAYHLANDSVTVPKALIPGWGRMTFTPDGDTVCLSNPGLVDTIDPQQSLPPLIIHEPDGNRVVEWFDNWDLFSDSNWVAPPNDLAVTPDGRWLVMLGGAESLRVIYCWDLDNREMTHTEAWGGNGHAFTNLSLRRVR